MVEIRVENLNLTIGSRDIFRAPSLHCRPGSMTVLVGPSGCGKTTLLHCMGLLQRPTSGAVLIDGADATNWSGRRRRKFWSRSCAFVLQDYGLMDEESVASNVTMRTSVFRRRPVVEARTLESALELTGLSGRETQPAIQLSGGEKQRLAVARALYKDARLVLVDEPTASLDAANRQRLLEIFDLLRRQGRTLVIATHDDDVMHEADSVYVVDEVRHVAPGGIGGSGDAKETALGIVGSRE